MFVGERRSLLAIRQGWTWESGRVAARSLFQALRAAGIEPELQRYTNLYLDPPRPFAIHPDTLAELERLLVADWTLVALGKRVRRDLERLKVPHLVLVHPAARGSIRRRENYAAHVRRVLCNGHGDLA